MRGLAAAVFVLLIGCGRVNYDPLGGANDAAIADAAAADAPRSLRETWTFGEVDGTTVDGVTSDTLMCDGGGAVNLNWGAFGRIEAGPFCTGLLRFDLSALPADIAIVDASLAVWPELVPSREGIIDVHRVIEPWQEGSLTGQAGEANYDQRLPGVDWTDRGARPPGSSDPTPLHTFHPAVFDAQLVPLPAALIDDWHTDPASNHGLAFFGSEDYGSPDSQHPHLISSDNANVSQRPVLTITFDRQ